ncbi:GCN5-related N-acetyltransferase 10, chloroplastic-like [Vicia villosa]|uniref:GCN5-related N-acetyltransferase 10, chloroplastic-like n=1 Tax=Vicia villosa TaxID=3911 RepID=UPI00273B74AC|nr:GCN5-related N-acetyltransferase 10, chloroplastic-like [Vicia villosa]
MAHLFSRTSYTSHKLVICSNIRYYDVRTTPRNACYRVRRGKTWNGSMLQCCSSSSRSSSQQSYCADQKVNLQTENDSENLKQKFEILACEYGWRIRRLIVNTDEIKMAAQVQAEAFHVPMALFNDLFFHFFKAEVLSGLLYKLKCSPPNRYACLVAENDQDSPNELVGVIDVTVMRDQDVLEHLPDDAQEYLYVSGIAVSSAFRRMKIGTVMLKACDMLSNLWGFEFLVLRAYEEDVGARTLYTNAGYEVVSKDPPWTSNWIGRKCRVLMIKRISLFP